MHRILSLIKIVNMLRFFNNEIFSNNVKFYYVTDFLENNPEELNGVVYLLKRPRQLRLVITDVYSFYCYKNVYTKMFDLCYYVMIT